MPDDPAKSVTFDFLDEELSRDVRASLEAGIAAGAVFEDEAGPDELLRLAVRRAITAIEAKDHNDLLPRFLAIGPYFDSGPIPAEAAGRYMGDHEVAAAIRLIFSSAINSFQGQLAEILAVGPIVKLAREIAGQSGGTGSVSTVFVGDTVLAHTMQRRTWAKAADFHLLECGVDGDGAKTATVCGVAEVKSYAISVVERLWPQVDKHLARIPLGLQLQGENIGAERVVMSGGSEGPAQIVVVPETWKLPRRFWFENDRQRRVLVIEPPSPPLAEDTAQRLAPNRWQVTLRWSNEALAETAFRMTFWYMGELGRLLYERNGVPRDWSKMTPEQAGQNAVKMMLYYAILRAHTGREASRATALYNSYGFGYALGSSFVDRRGRRQVLFVEDLNEILATGRSRTEAIDLDHPAQFCRIRGRAGGSHRQ